MGIDEAADELYAVDPDRFVERRTALVAAARAAKDRELVKQIGALRRPTRTAWLVNQLARAEPKRIAELIALGEALQTAQRAMAGDDLRRLSRDRRTTIDTLARRAVQLGSEQGYQAPEAALQEVSQTLQAALSDPAVAEQVRRGRLVQAAAYGGFGPDDLASALTAMSAAPRPQLSVVPPLPDEPDEPDEGPDEAELAARAAAEEAARAVERARSELALAEAAADAATARADELADRVEEMRADLRKAEAAERAARDEARDARKALTAARKALAALTGGG